MTREEKMQVDELIRNAMCLVEIVDSHSRVVGDILRTLAVARSARNDAIVLASSWNPYRIWNS